MISKLKLLSSSSNDHRTLKAKKNILASFCVKSCSIVISLILVPLTLGYLNPYEYGIWLTLSSLLLWINQFDIGLGNGLRNRLSEALALGNRKLAQIYVSTTFFLLLMIMLLIYIIFLFFQQWINWEEVLNIESDAININLTSLVSIIFALFCISFVLKFIGNIYLANQLSVINDLFVFLGNLLSAVVIYFLTLTTKGDLNKVAIAFSASPVIIYLIAYPITFRVKYKDLMPSYACVRFRYAKDLIGLGFQFFVIQVTSLVMFTTSNVIISQILNPSYVTPYNIVSRYYNVLIMIYGIVIAPFWSAITEAYVMNDYLWIKKSIRMMFFVWMALTFFSFVMYLCSNWVYKLWIGDSIEISLSLSLVMCLYSIITNWNSMYLNFIYGIGKIRLQLYYSLFSSICFIPLAIFLTKKYGVIGIVIAMCCVLLISAIILPIQYSKLISRKASGIWSK